MSDLGKESGTPAKSHLQIPKNSKHVRLQLSLAHQDKLRKLAASHRVSMAAMARTIIMEALDVLVPRTKGK